MPEKVSEFQGRIGKVSVASKFDKDTGEYLEASVTITFTDRDAALKPFREIVSGLVGFSKGAVDIRVSRPVLLRETTPER